jgi:hypothetical protein
MSEVIDALNTLPGLPHVKKSIYTGGCAASLGTSRSAYKMKQRGEYDPRKRKRALSVQCRLYKGV